MGAKIPSWNGRFIPLKKKHKLGSLSILLHLGGFKFSLREIFGEVRQQIDRKGGLGSPGWKNWKFHLWAGRLRCSHLEGANPSGSARQCFRGKPDSPWAPAWAEICCSSTSAQAALIVSCQLEASMVLDLCLKGSLRGASNWHETVSWDALKKMIALLVRVSCLSCCRCTLQLRAPRPS